VAEQLKSRDEVREAVRERYAGAASRIEAGDGDCCGPSSSPLGCGNPTAVADLAEGDVVLDLGSGDGTDVLISARRVGTAGKAYGLDMTDEMLGLARRNQAEAGVENVEFLRGTIEAIPLPDDSVDVIISNCVINLSGDKPAVLREAARVLRPGGRFAVTDIVADTDMDDATRADLQQWTGCIAGALTAEEFDRELRAAGFVGVTLEETHRVHEHAGSAIIRARTPITPSRRADAAAPGPPPGIG
jgi:arsenite methyltransferase